MSRQRLFLLTILFVLGSIAVALLSALFVSSLMPSEATKNNREMAISLAAIPDDEFREFDWNGWKVFLKKSPQVHGFLMPFQDGSYRLPDLTWERTAVRCRAFRFEAGYFRCFDPGLPSWWLDNARWNEEGVSSSRYIPPLQKPLFILDGKELILGRQPPHP